MAWTVCCYRIGQLLLVLFPGVRAEREWLFSCMEKNRDMFHALLADSCLKTRDKTLASPQKWSPGAAKTKLCQGALLSLQFHKQTWHAAHTPVLSPKPCRAYSGQQQVGTPEPAVNYVSTCVFALECCWYPGWLSECSCLG